MKERSTTQKIKDRLFAYPNSPTPDSLKALYLVAWRYIIGDFYKVEFENYTFHHVPVIDHRKNSEQVHGPRQLVRGREPPDKLSTARTHKASQGRKPKIKSAHDLSTPIFTTNDKGALIMNTNLSLVAEALNIAERLA